MLLCMIWFIFVALFGAYCYFCPAVWAAVRGIVVVGVFILAALAGLLHQAERSDRQHRELRQARELQRRQETQRQDRLFLTSLSELERSLGR